MGSLLNDVNTLIAKRVGDLPRLEHIKETIENNKKLYNSDQNYLNELIEKHLFSNDGKDKETSTKHHDQKNEYSKQNITNDIQNPVQNKKLNSFRFTKFNVMSLGMNFIFFGISYFLLIYPFLFFDFDGFLPGVSLTSTPSIMYTFLSLPIIFVIHWLGHKIILTSENIRVKSNLSTKIKGCFTMCHTVIDDQHHSPRISKLKFLGAGSTTNFLFAIVLGAIMLTNPIFGMVLESIPLFGEVILNTFYEVSQGVLILSIIENSGAEQAGLLANDVITTINDIPIHGPADFPILNPGETASVSILRDGQALEFGLEVMASPDDPQRGLIGIMRDNSIPYKPVMDFIDWTNVDFNISMFLLWLCILSFNFGMIHILPLPFTDGGKFFYQLISKKLSKKISRLILFSTYVFTLSILYLPILIWQIGFQT